MGKILKRQKMSFHSYLTRRFYLKNWPHTSDTNKHVITIMKGNLPSIIPTDKINFIETEEIHWINFLPIHNWFVKNAQNGIDDDREYRIPFSKIQLLHSIIQKILNTHSKANLLLPDPENKYKDSYFSVLSSTNEILLSLIENNNEEGEFYYFSNK
jgi:hypothetical protein